MKNAILFFGQPRFIKNKLVQNCYKNLIELYNCDVFAHVWFAEDVSFFSCSSWAGVSQCRIEKDALQIIRDIYMPKLFLYEKPTTFAFQGALREKINDKFTHTNEHWNDVNYSNVLSQLYSIEQVSRLFSSIDTEQYKFIILARLDTILTNFPNLTNSDESKFYIQNNHPRFPDVITIYGRRFLEWSNNVYSDTIINPQIYQNFWEPSAECLKYNSFKYRFQDTDIYPCDVRGQAIRCDSDES